MASVVWLLSVLAWLVVSSLICAVPASALTLYTNYTFLNSTLSSLPYNESVRTATLTTISNLLQSYTFVDLAINSTENLLPPLVDQIVPMQVDIVGCVNGLLAPSSFPSDVSMHEALASCFYPLNDAHTRYVKPPPYSYSVFTLPFRVQAVNATLTEPPKLVVVDSPVLLAAYEAIYGKAAYTRSANSSQLTLMQIDKQDAFAVLRDYADSNISYTKDAFSRFNLAVHGYGDGNGYYFYRNQITFARPPSETILFTFQDVDPGGSIIISNFQISWIGMYTPPNATFARDLHAQMHGALVGPQADNLLANHFEQLKNEERVDEFHRQGLRQRRWTTELDFIREHATLHSPLPSVQLGASAVATVCPRPSLGVSPLSGSCYGDAYVAFIFPNSSSCLGVLRVFSFSPKNEAQFASIVQSSLLAHSQYCAAQKQTAELLIDLRANGGGIISLGYALLRFLFPGLARPQAATGALSPVRLAAEKANLDERTPSLCYGRYDLRSSSLFQVLASTADWLSVSPTGFGSVNCSATNADFFASCMWNDAISNTPFLDSKWMTVPRQFTRGGRSSGYSAAVRENCQPSFEMWPLVDEWQGYNPANVTLLSDGLCGSTCAVFSSFVQTLGFGKTVVYSAFLSQAVNGGQQQFYAFPGGQVETLDEIVEMLTKWNLTTSISPSYQLLPNSASIRFAIREIYPWPMSFDAVPLEYVFYPAHFHKAYTTHFLDDAAIYAQVVKEVVPSCVQDVTLQPCNVVNGVGVVPCVNGQLQTDKCKVLACNAGYYAIPSASGSATDALCLPCGVGEWSVQNDVDFQLTSPLSTSCTRCFNAPPVVTVSLSDGNGGSIALSCSTRYTTTTWTDSQCPYDPVCPAAQLPSGSSGDDKKAAVVVLAVLLALTGTMAVGLSCYVIRQQQARTDKESVGLLGHRGHHTAAAEPL